MDRKLSMQDATVLALCEMIDDEDLINEDCKPLTEATDSNFEFIFSEINATSFDELKEAVESLLDDELIEEEDYDNIENIISEQEEKCIKYIEDRSKVTNTDWKDTYYIEEDYVKGAIEKIVAILSNENTDKLTEERYYYGEIEGIKDRIKSNITSLTSTIEQLEDMHYDEDSEYTDTQMDKMYQVSEALRRITKSLTALNNELAETFPNRIRQLTPEEKEYIEQHYDEIEKKTEQKVVENKEHKLVENELTNLASELPEEEVENNEDIDKGVTGVVDGILVIVDPEINEEDYEEVIERANEIIEETPEGKIPFIEDYLNQYIQTCPICGKTFVSKQLLQSGDTCPLCLEQPESFITVGKIEPDEEQEAELENDKQLDNDIETEQDIVAEEQDDLEQDIESEDNIL